MSMSELGSTPLKSVSVDQARMILALRRAGVRGTILEAMETVPRQQFLFKQASEETYKDVGIDIPCGQQSLRPTDIGRMLVALAPERHHSILEIGGGAGYVSALLGLVSKNVLAIERFTELADLSRDNLRSLKIKNVDVLHGDGLVGEKLQAPYDRILFCGAIKFIPDLVGRQLADGGIIVAPILTPSGETVLKRFTRSDFGGVDELSLGSLKVLPLISGKG